MAFSSNSYQQLGFGDRTMMLSDKDRAVIENSWAGYFAGKIFPKIEESRFKPLYSRESASPNSPVNVTVGALILEAVFGYTDEEIVSAIICDMRFQYALCTSGEVTQPVSMRTLQRFRKRCADYRTMSGVDLLRDCLESFYGDLDNFLRDYFPGKNLDAARVIDIAARSGAAEVFDERIVTNPEVFKQNVLPAHSDHVAFASKQEMEDEKTSLRYSLNGLWKFQYAKNPESALPGFEKTSVDCSKWDEIPVPAHIQMEGYDKPAYVNYQYPWDGREDIRPGKIPTKYNPVASYVKYFTLPESLQGAPLYISFQGVESGFALWLNGYYVGYSEDSFTPSEFDLTPYVIPGENKLAVRVYKWTSSSWLEDQDMFRFSGIFRDVYLFTTPSVHVYDLKIRTHFSDATFETAQLLVNTKLTTTADTTQKHAFGFMEYTLQYGGKVVASGEIDCEEENEITERISNVHLWSAENPALYDLYLYVHAKSGEVVEAIHEKVGFRQFAMKDGIMCLNGRRIVFKGVNRHEFTCDGGRAGMSIEQIRKDLTIMKQNNINAIRTSHYPDDSKLYRLCDEFGLYLIAENNLETHGSWAPYAWKDIDKLREERIPGSRPEWREVLLDRVRSCYERDKNHPAILIWSCGNESAGGSVIYDMSQLFRSLDPDRLVHYEGVFNDREFNDTSDMESQMYPPVVKIREFLAQNPDKPFICCEYSHSMGNSNGNMFQYTDLTDTEPRYQGGFIWDFVDQSIRTKDRFGEEFQGYGGDFGDRPCDYSFSGNGIVAGDRMPYPKLQDVKFNYQNITARVSDDQVLVINKNLFISTAGYRCIAELARNGEVIRREEIQTNVAPLSQKAYMLPFGRQELPGEYAITVSFRLKVNTIWAKHGHEIAFGQHVYVVEAGKGKKARSASLEGPQEITYCGNGISAWRTGEGFASSFDKEVAAQLQKHFRVMKGTFNVGVAGETFDALFSFLNGGGLKSWRVGGREMILETPRPNFWRAPTDNDKGNQFAARYGQWKLASLYAALMPADLPDGADASKLSKESVSIKAGKDYAEVKLRYFLPTVPISSVDVTCRMQADGTLRYTMDYTPVDGLIAPPEFGMLFKLDRDYENITFYGNGPEECYADRERGARLGIYETSVTDSMTRYLVPQECGNHTGVRWAKVTDARGRGLLFGFEEGTAIDTGDGRVNGLEGGMNFSALPYTPEEIEQVAHHTEFAKSRYTVVRCSLMQMGVAGDDSWGARTQEQFCLPRKPLHFSFSVKAI